VTGKPRASIPEADPERRRRASELAAEAPLPARRERVRFGTAGWTDRTLIQSKLFYPPRARTPELRLKHYAAHFELVEVDATYYTLLEPAVVARWVEWTPETFRFDVKAFPILTGHPIDVLRLPTDLRAACQAHGFERRVYPDRLPPEIAHEIHARFAALLAPLASAGRLGAVLLQFPPWFSATRANAKKLEDLRRDHPELPFAVELRNASWFLPERRERLLDLLREQRMSFVAVDAPSGVPPLVAVTRPELAIVRFHGHNRAGWAKPGAAVEERFNYLYDPDELRAWVEPVAQLAVEAAEVHAVFNNCVRDYAVLNAKDLAVLMERAEATHARG